MQLPLAISDLRQDRQESYTDISPEDGPLSGVAVVLGLLLAAVGPAAHDALEEAAAAAAAAVLLLLAVAAVGLVLLQPLWRGAGRDDTKVCRWCVPPVSVSDLF